MFRTPIGFHVAYVAAASQKAALAAWGTDTDLFARGVAEVVTDPALTREPLARPGEVVRVLRGSAAEQVRALGITKKKEAGPRIESGVTKKESGRKESGSRISSGMTKKEKGDRPSPRPSPAGGSGRKKRGARPSSAAVDKAEKALERAEARHRAALDKLRAEVEALERRRRELERTQRGKRGKLGAALDEARERFRKAMADWAG